MSKSLSNPNRVLVETGLEYIIRWHPANDIFDEEAMEKLRNLKDMDDIREIRDTLFALVSVVQELSVYFKVPNQQMLSNITPPPTCSPNQIVASFISFLLAMIEAIIYHESACISFETISIENLSTELKFLVQNLQTELGFLCTFLGDTSMHLQPIPTDNIMIDIEAVVNQVGSFIFSYFLTTYLHTEMISTEEDDWLTNKANIEAIHNDIEVFLLSNSVINKSFEDISLQTTMVEDINNAMIEVKDLVQKVQNFMDFFIATENDQVQETGIVNLALSNLLPKFEFLNTKIKEHCYAASKLPSIHMAPNTAVVSLFIVDSILDDLVYLINNKSHKTDGVNDQIVRLHEELMLLASSVNEIAEEQEQQAKQEQLIIQARDAAYEVEFIINSLPPVWYLNLRLPQLIHKIQLITIDIKKIKKQTDAVGEEQVEKYLEEQASSPSKQTPVLEDNVVGFKQVEKEIMEQLVRGKEHLQIISMFGMPGLGKTTLANKLYNHPSVIKHFDCRAWCVSSQIYNRKNMLNDILMSLGHKRDDIMGDGDLGGKFYKFVKRRRYLLVIDDIWDIKTWNDLKRYFPDDGTGSRILFTTRNKQVGLEASASVVKELPFLSEPESWELLQRKVFQDEIYPKKLLDIAKSIATKCQGLPLAVVTVAGILANLDKEEYLWRQVESSISSHITRSEDKCMQLLKLGYKHLPTNLKPCFLYFGAFDEDAEIPVQMLTSIWIAERFIKEEEGKSLEDVALEYLIKLIDRSLVLVSRRGSNGQVKACKIHDLLLDLCSKIAKENLFFEGDDSDDDRELYQQHHCVRITYNSNDWNYMRSSGLHVRSLLCDDNSFSMLVSCNFKVLKVFRFYASRRDFTVIGIKHLVQLRYLAIQSKMPAIENFHRLEFLEVEDGDDIEITEFLLNMVNLRRMHFKGGAFFSESCRRRAMKEESFQINNKVMQSISLVKISDEIDEKILQCFPSLRRLDAKLQGSFKFSFDFLDHLESLKLMTERSSVSFINLPPNLKKLTLSGGYVSSEQMGMIERLEYLEVLKLYDLEFEKQQWDTSEDAFLQLKVLKIMWVRISEWNASSDAFSSLRRLILGRSGMLDAIPSVFGDISTLHKVELIRCSNWIKKSAEQIKNYQKDMGNEELQVIEFDYY